MKTIHSVSGSEAVNDGADGIKNKTRKPKMYPKKFALDFSIKTKPSEILETSQDKNLDQMEKKVAKLSFENFSKKVQKNES